VIKGSGADTSSSAYWRWNQREEVGKQRGICPLSFWSWGRGNHTDVDMVTVAGKMPV